MITARGATAELLELRKANARLTRERDEAQAELAALLAAVEGAVWRAKGCNDADVLRDIITRVLE